MSPLRQPGRLARLIVLYSTIRLTVFLAVVLVLIPVHVNVLVRLAIAFVGSAIVSYPLARKQRTEMSVLLEARHRARMR
jgi:Protein of unknown function (DUF4229)